MNEIHESFVEHIQAELGTGGEVMIFAGDMAIHAVKFEMQPAHPRLAWLVNNEHQELLLDVGSIYAVRTLVEVD